MADHDCSCLLTEGDCMGMTDKQYSGLLIDQLKSWKKVLELSTKSGDTEVQKVAEIEIEAIADKLRS